MTEEDEPVGILLAIVTVGLVAGLLAYIHRQQWPERLLRQIRALPEAREHATEETP